MKITRERIGLSVLLAGLSLATVSGRIFSDKFFDIAEQTNDARVELYDNIYEGRSMDVIKMQQRDDRALTYSASGIIAGSVIAGIGYALARMKQYKDWSPHPEKELESFSLDKRNKQRQSNYSKT